MKEITKLMIKRYALMKLKYDFMGYRFQNTSHDYLHRIESVDYDMFLAITSEMIDENIKGYLDMKNLMAINDILNNFEREYCSLRTKKGRPLIKEEYTRRVLKK